MKRVIKASPKPTEQEEIKLNRVFYLPGWQFEKLIENNCTLVQSRIIRWNKNEPEYAGIYGLRAMQADSGKPCFGNFFVHFKSSVYQFSYIEDCTEIIELIKKQKEYDEYESKIWRQRFNEKEKRKKEREAFKKSTSIKKVA